MPAFRLRLLIALGCAASSLHASGAEQSGIAVTPAGSSLQIPATLIKPDGVGLFPAVVILHDCSGLGPRSSGAPMRWADALVPRGYVVLIPDSFTPRGFANGVCTIPGKETRRVSPKVRAADAYGALAALRALPYVDGKRIGVMGGSHGGSTTLATMSAPVTDRDPLADVKRAGFAAAVALYPGCGVRYGMWSVTRANGNSGQITGYTGAYEPLAPLLILIGEKDDWTPAEPCRRLVETGRAAGFPIDIKVYPDAYHAFDSNNPVRYDARRNNMNAPSGRGATTGGNPAAWADALQRVAGFFARYLQPRQ